MSTMVQFNKFHIGELVHNHDISKDGKIVGFRDTVGIPEYKVIVPIEANNGELGRTLTLWPETALEPSTLSSQWPDPIRYLQDAAVPGRLRRAPKSSGSELSEGRRCKMRIIGFIRSLLLVLAILAMPAASSAQVAVSITIGPPALPIYEQPICPDAGYIWTPGYWAYGPEGYFWVPGTWVLVPESGLLWTPGYWGWGDGVYIWYPGYWGPHVGFYGGINYGYGYGGVGYEGGYWNNGAFNYNRSVNNVSTTNITNVYNKTVINNTTVNNVSYNGGTGGTNAQPTTAELAAAHERHTPATGEQTQHERGAGTNHAQLASVNHGQPAIVATPKPGLFTGHGVITASRVAAPYHAMANGAAAKGTVTPSVTSAHPNVATPLQPNNSAPQPPKIAPHPESTPRPERKPQPPPPPPPPTQHHNPPPPEEKPKPQHQPPPIQ
jgi:hypothetical protein